MLRIFCVIASCYICQSISFQLLLVLFLELTLLLSVLGISNNYVVKETETGNSKFLPSLFHCQSELLLSSSDFVQVQQSDFWFLTLEFVHFNLASPLVHHRSIQAGILISKDGELSAGSQLFLSKSVSPTIHSNNKYFNLKISKGQIYVSFYFQTTWWDG